jgi:hypothetical protein
VRALRLKQARKDAVATPTAIAEGIKKLCDEYVAEHSSVPPKP